MRCCSAPCAYADRVTTEDDFRKRRERFVEELAITRRLANEIIGLTAQRARAKVEAAGRQWAENCVTDDLGSHRVRVTVEDGVVTKASGG